MSVTVAPTYNPIYAADSVSTSEIKAHSKGYCPIHKDIKIRKWVGLNKQYEECSSSDGHRLLVEEKRLQIDRMKDDDNQKVVLQKALLEIESLRAQKLESERLILLAEISAESEKQKRIEAEDQTIQFENRNTEILSAAKALELQKAADDRATANREAENLSQLKAIVKERLSVVKLGVFGDTAVGKSCIVGRFVRDEFFANQVPTLGAEFSSQVIRTEEVQNQTDATKFTIWDTPGQERYRKLAPMYYRDCQVCIIVYDITNRVRGLFRIPTLRYLLAYITTLYIYRLKFFRIPLMLQNHG